MKANQVISKEEELWTSITTCLIAAEQAVNWSSFRELFNTNHPLHVRNEEIENPKRWAQANWNAAKHLYCENKEMMDRHFKFLCDPHIGKDVYPGISFQCEMFIAMRRVVEKEMEEELENQILKEETMGRKQSLENLGEDVDFEVEELDEDEQYIKETGGHFEGDDYVANDDDLDEDEEYDDDLEDDEE